MNPNLKRLHLSPRRAIGLAAIAVILLCLFLFTSTYTIVQPQYNAGATDVRAASYDPASQETAGISKLFGFLLVPRDTEMLIFTSAGAESRMPAPRSSSFLGVARPEVNLTKPVAGKLANIGSEQCTVINQTGSYSYSCEYPTGFSAYNPSGGINKQRPSTRFNAKFTSDQYKEGILTWTDFSDTRDFQQAGFLNYVVPDKGVVNSIRMPKEIYGAEYVQIITDRADVQNTGFVVYDYAAGTGYYYKDSSSREAPKIYKRQSRFDRDNESASCVLSGTIFSCYYGAAGEDTHEPNDSALAAPEYDGGAIEQADMAAQDIRPKIYRNGRSQIDDLYATVGGQLFARGGETVSRVSLRGSGFGLTTVSSTSAIAVAGNLLYYVQDAKVYAYDPAARTATLRYESQGQTVHKLTAYGSQVAALSYRQRDPLQLLSVYDISLNPR